MQVIQMISIKNPFILSKYNINKAIVAIHTFFKIIYFSEVAPFSSNQNMEIKKTICLKVSSSLIDAERHNKNIQTNLNNSDHFSLQRKKELRKLITIYQPSGYLK